MVPPKKKKRKKPVRKTFEMRRSWKSFAAMGLFFFILGGLVVFLALRSDKAIAPPEADDGGTGPPPLQYEEPLAPAAPATVGKDAGERRPSPAKKKFAAVKELPVIAIVIDDMGYNRKVCEALLDLDLRLSFAFLPFGPYTEDQVDLARRRNRDVLLHFPMEATDPKWRPDGHTVTIDMARPEMGRIFAANLNEVSGAVGINNHMGSRFTQNSGAMGDFIALVRERELFFLDSRTSRNSVAESLAAEMGVKTARRDIFLDNVREPQAIIIQLRKLLDLAGREGRAVAIGHPYPETLEALKMMRREIPRRANLVGVGELVR
ncbi:MAG: divergent polysaccharide deacetylase family protein [Desulfobulbales bacterium]|nr:divergent polysaccharide deacetylase family protein [Desulfobulbales bacterium]